MSTPQSRKDPFLAFRYALRIDGKELGGFSECTGLQLETEIFSYREGGQNLYELKFPTFTKQSNIMLKRGIADWTLWEWYEELLKGRVTRRNGTIILLDRSGSSEEMAWTFEQAFPIKWMGPDMNGTQNNVAVETLELCYHILRKEQNPRL